MRQSWRLRLRKHTVLTGEQDEKAGGMGTENEEVSVNDDVDLTGEQDGKTGGMGTENEGV